MDMIAAGCDPYVESEKRQSFLVRAREHLSGARVSVKWLSGEEPKARPPDSPENRSPDAYSRTRYLSQQFVEELCSIEGMPALIREIERVIFEAHPSLDRDGAVDFGELLELRARLFSDSRIREEKALANISDQIGVEREKTRQVAPLKAQIAEKEKQISRYQGDRTKLLPKTKNETGERLQELLSAAEKVRGYLRHYANRQASLVGLKHEVQDQRQNLAPEALRAMKERYPSTALDPTDWDRFLLEFSGDVDSVLATKTGEAEKSARLWRGETPTSPVDDGGAFLTATANPAKTPLAILEAEIERLEKLVAADRDTARKLSAVAKRIADETTALERLKERLTDCEGAANRTARLVNDREQGYVRVFAAIFGEEQCYTLYAPLAKRLEAAGGTLEKY
ncbi:MAG: ATP-binding protein, partial [Rhodospirillales bacterium]|nr:ATP-binding protein [Rhodospirillales bacterium]